MRGMRKEQLEAAIVKTTRMLAAKSIKVTQRGTGAYCAWHPVTGAVIAINLPVFPDNPSQEFLDAIQGYLDHEVAHALYTDALALEASEKASSLNTSPRAKAELHMFGNVVEDVRIEARIPVDFPGAEANLNKLRSYIVDTVWRPVLTKLKAQADAGDAAALSNFKGTALIPYLRGLAGQSICADLTKEMDLDATFADLNAAIPDLQKRLKAMKSSTDAFEIAELIMKVNAPPPQEAKPDQGDDAGEGESKQSPQKAPKDEGDDKEQDEGEGAGGSEDPSESEKHAADDDADDDDATDDAPEADDEEQGEGAAGEEDDDAEEGESKDTDGSGGEDGSEDGQGSGESDEDDDCSGDEPGEDDDSGAGADQDGDDQAGEDEGKSSKGDGEDKGDDNTEAGDDEGSQGGDGGDQNGDASQTDNPESGTEGEQGEIDGETEDGDDDAKSAPGVGCDLGIDLSEAKDIDGMLEDQLKGMMKGAFDGRYQVSFTNDWDRIEPYDDKGGKTPDVKGMEDKLRPVIQPMQKELQRIIVARSHSYYTPGFRRGRINPAALHRAPTGDDRLFRKKQEAVTNKVAMSLLIDNSGSMGDMHSGGSSGRITTAMQAAWAFAETLDRLKIASDVLGFTNCAPPADVDWDTVHKEIDDMMTATGLPRSVIRTSPAYLPIYKGFDEKFGPAQKRRMAHLIANQSIMRSNNDAVAIDYAGRRLLSRDETRKIMIVFSDGQPADNVDCTCLYASTKANVERLERMGVEVIGIGIQSDAVKHFYKRHYVLTDVAALPQFVMSQLKGLLTPGR